MKKTLRRRYGKSKSAYYRYYVRVGGKLLRNVDGHKIWFATPRAARELARQHGGKVVSYSHDRRPK
ncbi:MAG: hypothetical protein ACHREM_16725 [Polyangiales bacterium]